MVDGLVITMLVTTSLLLAILATSSDSDSHHSRMDKCEKSKSIIVKYQRNETISSVIRYLDKCPTVTIIKIEHNNFDILLEHTFNNAFNVTTLSLHNNKLAQHRPET